MSGVEFLGASSPPETDEEDLAPPPRRERLHRLWLPVLAVVLVVAALVVVSTNSSNDPTPAPSPTAGPTVVSVGRLLFTDPATNPDSYVGVPVPGIGGLGPLAGVPGLPAAVLPDGTLPCPLGQAWLLSRSVPTPVRAAVLAAFPAAVLHDSVTLRAYPDMRPPALWFRQVRAQLGPVTLTIRVVVPAEAGSGFAGDHVAVGAGFVADYRVVAADGGLVVVVHAVGPAPLRVDPVRLTRLAADGRLLTNA